MQHKKKSTLNSSFNFKAVTSLRLSAKCMCDSKCHAR